MPQCTDLGLPQAPKGPVRARSPPQSRSWAPSRPRLGRGMTLAGGGECQPVTSLQWCCCARGIGRCSAADMHKGALCSHRHWPNWLHLPSPATFASVCAHPCKSLCKQYPDCVPICPVPLVCRLLCFHPTLALPYVPPPYICAHQPNPSWPGKQIQLPNPATHRAALRSGGDLPCLPAWHRCTTTPQDTVHCDQVLQRLSKMIKAQD